MPNDEHRRKKSVPLIGYGISQHYQLLVILYYWYSSDGKLLFRIVGQLLSAIVCLSNVYEKVFWEKNMLIFPQVNFISVVIKNKIRILNSGTIPMHTYESSINSSLKNSRIEWKMYGGIVNNTDEWQICSRKKFENAFSGMKNVANEIALL